MTPRRRIETLEAAMGADVQGFAEWFAAQRTCAQPHPKLESFAAVARRARALHWQVDRLSDAELADLTELVAAVQGKRCASTL